MRQFKENSITERNITKREYGRSSCNPAHFWCSKGVIYAFYSGVCALIMSSFKSPKFVFCLLAMVDLYESEIIYPISLKKSNFLTHNSKHSEYVCWEYVHTYAT